MDPTNKQKGPLPHYSLYQHEVFKNGGTKGQCTRFFHDQSFPGQLTRFAVPSFSVHPEELAQSTKKKLNDRGYFYANSNAGLGWTDRANRYALNPTETSYTYQCRSLEKHFIDGASSPVCSSTLTRAT